MSSPGRKRWVMVPAAIAAGTILGGVLLHQHDHPVPDEKSAGVALLAKQQAGPGYFHEVKADPTPFDTGGPWIALDEVQRQKERVVRERKMDEAQAKALDQLISQLSETHPSRAVGGERIQLVKLNLALDKL